MAALCGGVARTLFFCFALQVHNSQLSQLRAITHRAAADMERWRTTTGAQQQVELLAYWNAWTSRMAATRETNDRLLLFFRTAAATTELMASGMAASAEIIAPLTLSSHAAAGHRGRGSGESGDSSVVSTRHAQSLAVTAAALRELHGQVAGSLRGLARVVSAAKSA